MKSKFLIKMKRLISWKYFSTFQSIFKWPGLEITDVRRYASGDPLKYINRKTSAKHNELYTSLFQQEKEITLDVFFDINYNWRDNLEKVIEFFWDMIVYCQKNGIKVHLFYSTGWLLSSEVDIHAIAVEKHRERAYQFVDTLISTTKKTAKKYQSGLSKFLELAKNSKKRRAIVILSDFLDVEEKDRASIKYFTNEHSLSLVRIPVDHDEWQNYNSFILDPQKAWDVESLQTLEL